MTHGGTSEAATERRPFLLGVGLVGVRIFDGELAGVASEPGNLGARPLRLVPTGSAVSRYL